MTTVQSYAVDDVASCTAAEHHEQTDCTTSSQHTSSTETPPVNSTTTTLPTPAGEVKQEQTEQDSSEPAGEDSKAEDRPGLQYNELALILRLQRDMATMQLQLSKLQDAMRTANITLQLLLQRAFDTH